jgi:hypothetical protein
VAVYAQYSDVESLRVQHSQPTTHPPTCGDALLLGLLGPQLQAGCCSTLARRGHGQQPPAHQAHQQQVRPPGGSRPSKAAGSICSSMAQEGGGGISTRLEDSRRG